MPITPGEFDPVTQQGELKITDATVHCRTRAQAEAVAHRLEQKIDWPDDCAWPEQEPMTPDLKHWSARLEAAQLRWNEAVRAYAQAGGTKDLVEGYWIGMLWDLNSSPPKPGN